MRELSEILSTPLPKIVPLMTAECSQLDGRH
jgi:hypothetical protein